MPIDHTMEIPENFRVLLIDLSKRYGGASVRALTLAAHMQPGSVAIAGLKDSPVMKIAQERNISVRIVGRYRADPLIPFRLSKIIRKEGFQVIDTQNIQSKFWASLVSLITDVAFVSTLNSSYKDEQGRALKGKFYALVDQCTNFRTDGYIAVSAAIRQGLLKDGISEAMVDLVTNAVETDDSFQVGDPKLIRKQMGISEDSIVCVSVGRLVWAKGFEDFITAFMSVSEQVPNSYALILGDGVLRPDLSHQIKIAGLENRIFLLGYCEPRKVLSVLKASDIYVSSSRSEGVPFALLEAASQGLPIVSTHCGGIPDILTNNINALLVPIGDPSAIASAVIKLCFDRQLAQQLGSAAKKKILCDHGVQKQVEATKNAYQKAWEHKQL